MISDVCLPRRVLEADTIVVSFGLENLNALAGRSSTLTNLEMIDCRKLEGTNHDKNLEIHVGRNSRIMKSILGSKDYHEQHSHLPGVAVDWIFFDICLGFFFGLM